MTFIDPPIVEWSGELRLSGVTLHVHVLDDGTRVIEVQDMDALMDAWNHGASPPSAAEADAFTRWMHGGEL